MRHDHGHAAWKYQESCRECRRELAVQKEAQHVRSLELKAAAEARAEAAGLRMLVYPRSVTLVERDENGDRVEYSDD